MSWPLALNGTFAGRSLTLPRRTRFSQSSLYLIDLTTGAASLVGSTGSTQFGTMVFIDGVYYAGTATGSPYKVVTFDPNTAAVLTSQDSNSDIFWGLAPVANTPLPAALPLFATGLGVLGLGLLGWRFSFGTFAEKKPPDNTPLWREITNQASPVLSKGRLIGQRKKKWLMRSCACLLGCGHACLVSCNSECSDVYLRPDTNAWRNWRRIWRDWPIRCDRCTRTTAPLRRQAI